MTGIVERIRKLLALARDKAATEAEAGTALEMASRLMREHNIEQAQVDHAQAECDITRMSVGNDWAPWTIHVAVGVAALYRCRMTSSAWSRSGVVVFHGQPLNVQVAGETFKWVCEQVEQMYKDALRQYGGTLSKRGRAELRATFKGACALRIRQRCMEIEAAARNVIASHMSLVVVDKKLDEYMAVKFPGKGKEVKAVSYGIGTGAGISAGERVRIQREVR